MTTSGRARGSGTVRHTALAALALTVLYVALVQPTWSLDGAIHVLASVRANDDSASGHLLLRPVMWAWTAALGLVAPLTHAARYDALLLLFGAFGVAALTMLFWLAMRRSGAAGAWLALGVVAVSRNAERQIVNLDEKPLGMLLFAVALAVTAHAYECWRGATQAPRTRDLLPVALLWLVAVFGHLQSAPYALAALVGVVAFVPGPARGVHWLMLMARLLPVLVVAALALFALLYAGDGGLAALPRLAQHLFVDRAAATEVAGPVSLAKSALVGQVKAFFLIDRLSPRPAVAAAATGYAVLAIAIVIGLKRTRDALSLVLVAGTALLFVLMPAANAFPEYGDSYTMAVTAALVLLAAAPRGWLWAGLVLLWGVNLPAAVSYSRPETTQAAHLGRMIEVQERLDAPWVLVDELSPFDREQGLSPVYYAMSERLRHERHPWDGLPPGRFLLELPQVIQPDGASSAGRVHEVQHELAVRGRNSEPARLWSPLRFVRSDFRRYGDYLIVAPAGAQGIPAEPTEIPAPR